MVAAENNYIHRDIVKLKPQLESILSHENSLNKYKSASASNRKSLRVFKSSVAHGPLKRRKFVSLDLEDRFPELKNDCE